MLIKKDYNLYKKNETTFIRLDFYFIVCKYLKLYFYRFVISKVKIGSFYIIMEKL